ncbi:MAG: HipA domain-containing protein [Shewanella sp.]|nr:HipA domain-containing protein [Shewanella sp.]MCF1458792.1 HipA domain-containing protein [Shewanella sp.]
MLTIQIYSDGVWVDAATIEMPVPEAGRVGEAVLSYDAPYVLNWLDTPAEITMATSLTLPLELFAPYSSNSWFAFLDDIMPSGASRKYWINYLGLGNATPQAQDYELLKKGTIAPIGNMRIKESLDGLYKGGEQLRFSINDVAERNADFLEYAQQRGAAAGGATGAGGEAPKLLLRMDASEQIWIDTLQDDPSNQDLHYLVKFPRGSRSDIDCDILRAEFHYYQELAAMGIATIDVQNMRLVEGSRYPSLWLPRFDVTYSEGRLARYGMESVYSVLGCPPGTLLDHIDVISKICRQMSQMNVEFDQQRFVREWLERDFLNVCFGNSDNHGRNTAFVKSLNAVRLSPVYDFAPMKADPEGIPRSTQWPQPLELGGNFQWLDICDALSEFAPPDELKRHLKHWATQVKGLKHRLHTRGVPQTVLDMPVMGFDYLDAKLEKWGLQ